MAGGGALPALRRLELNGNKFSEDEEKVARLREAFSERREKAGAEEDDDGEGWGVDELSDMEEDSEEDENEDEDEVTAADEAKAERALKDADQEEEKKVAQKEDRDVDELADALGKTL